MYQVIGHGHVLSNVIKQQTLQCSGNSYFVQMKVRKCTFCYFLQAFINENPF